jgi:hypothetical protein
MIDVAWLAATWRAAVRGQMAWTSSPMRHGSPET